ASINYQPATDSTTLSILGGLTAGEQVSSVYKPIFAADPFANTVTIGQSDNSSHIAINGTVDLLGTFTKPSGSFKIDHPLDPEHKFLYHSFVESPDMKNIYDGTVVLDSDGRAWIELPAWFEGLNSDFRYQLTCIGGYAPVYIAQEVVGNRFQIAGGKAGLK